MDRCTPKLKTASIVHSIQSNNIFFFLIFALLIAFRIWIIVGIPKLYLYAPHDDLYFAKEANYLLNGQWLGLFDSLTLIKVPFYAMFLAFSGLTGLPLFLNENLLYIAACLVTYFALQPLMKNHWLRLLVFTWLLYCPAGLFTDWTQRVYREYVYFSLTLLVVACSIGLFLRVNANRKTMVSWAVGLGVSLGAFLITREEGVWIYPALFFLFLCFFWMIWKKAGTQKWQRSIILLIPLVLAYLPTFIVSYLNYSYYGFWGVSDQLDPNFVRVVNTLGRIKTDTTWYPYVRVSHEALNKAYAASPMMAELKDKLEYQTTDNWVPVSEQAYQSKPQWYVMQFSSHGTEIGAGHFSWALRTVIDELGYFSHGKYPGAYFNNLANELENACDTGKLECTTSLSIPFVGSFDKRHLPIIEEMFIYDARLFVKLSPIKIPPLEFERWPQYSKENNEYEKEFVVFDNVVHNPAYAAGENANSNAGSTWLKMFSTKSEIFHAIYRLYRSVTWILTLLSMLCTLILAVALILKRTDRRLEDLLLLIFLAGLLLTRFTTLVIVDATTTATGFVYGASNYLFLYVFIAIAIYTGISELWSFTLIDSPTKPGQSKARQSA